MVQKLTVILLLLSGLVGCATNEVRTSNRLTLDELNRMYVDCSNAELQIAYLNRQLNGRTEADYSTPEKRAYEQRYTAQAKSIIWQLRSQCTKSF